MIQNDDPMVAAPLVNRERAERIFALTLEQFWDQPEKADANLLTLDNMLYGLRGALETREAAAREGL